MSDLTNSLNWRTSLRFPPKPRLSQDCTDLLTKLLCEPEDRLGSQKSVSVNRPNSQILAARGSAFSTARGSALSATFGGLGSDGAEQIKSHPWFRGIDWDSAFRDFRQVPGTDTLDLHKTEPPYHPDLQSDDDTRHFDEDIPSEVRCSRKRC